MDAERKAVAQRCLNGAHSGSISFPNIVGTLMGFDFEGYEVNYRTGDQTFYMSDGETLALPIHPYTGQVNAAFDAAAIAALVQWAQSGNSDYSYPAFSERAKRAGCAGYLVSFLGRRVVYYGRTAETHVEHFPQ